MSTSPREGIVTIATSRYTNGGGSPVGNVVSRDVILNNLCHYADEFAQVRVAWASAATAITGAQGYLTPRTSSVSAGAYYTVAESHAWPIPLRSVEGPNGAGSYQLRVRIAGVSSDNTNTATFRLVLSPPGLGLDYVAVEADNVFEAATTSSAVNWLTGTSQGDAASGTLIHVPQELALTWATETATLTDIGGADRAVLQCLVSLSVFAKVSNTATSARLYGVYAAEWVGLT